MFDTLDAHITRSIQLTDSELAYFHSLLRPVSLKTKSFLLQAGEICTIESFVTKGCLRKYCLDEAGHEVILQFAIEDWWIADLQSFTTQTPSKLFIQALEDCSLLTIPYEAKEELFRKIPAMERVFRLMVQRSQAALQDRFVSILTQPAEERYLAFLKKYPQFPLRIPQHYIASYLGMTPEFLSKVRRRLAEKNK
ncbi:Crp/Fnr family transcriptional regulator [Spirosoma sp. SC4-14]|uniref:Crp/Fnr family transcriptional regulator n=1 Tax=Spirosoma sp. SC4-14 TaxID=3128900 RepID=UPI0030D1873B